MRVLITGSGGQVGRELVAAFSAGGHHEAIGVDHATVDVTDRDAVLGAITSTRPTPSSTRQPGRPSTPARVIPTGPSS